MEPPNESASGTRPDGVARHTPRSQVQFGLRKASIVFVIFAGLFALSRSAGAYGFTFALFLGMCLAGILVLGKRSDIVPCLRVAGGSLIGTVLSTCCCTAVAMPGANPSFGILVACVGAGIGGMTAALVNDLR